MSISDEPDELQDLYNTSAVLLAVDMVPCRGQIFSFKQDSLWSWFVCISTTFCMVLTVGFIFALGVLLPVFMDSFNESRERTG